MKKWQEWAIVAVVGVLIVAAVGATYWFLTEEKTVETVVTKTEEESDLATVESDLNQVNDLDLSALDAIDKDLQSINIDSL